MFAAGYPILYLPVLAWVATGLALLVAGRRSTAALLLRLSAGFFALWALLATTTLLFVITHGGGAGLVALLGHPESLFAPSAAPVWAAGAVGAGIVLALGFTINQLVGRSVLRTLAPRSMAWPHRLPRPPTPTQLGRFTSDRPEAFSFTLLTRVRGPGGPIGRREVILVSDGMLARLDPAEQEAVIAHELGHLHALDSRYLTFLRTCSRLLQWDPVVAMLARSVTRQEELRADRVAVTLTGRPASLASALRKVTRDSPPTVGLLTLGFVGRGRWMRPARTEERIQRLLELSESAETELP